MTKHLARLSVALGLVTTGLGLLVAQAPGSPPAPRERAAPGVSLEDELGRARLEQELILAERTALMLASFQEALATWESAEVTP